LHRRRPRAPSRRRCWGQEEHVRELFGDRVADVDARREKLRVDRFGSPEEFRDYFKANYGPTIAVYKNIADEPDRVQQLDRELVELAERFATGDRGEMDWEYLLLTAKRR
jgi:hypothetical protein